MTGLFTRQPELAAKQVEILKETFPDRTRLTVLWDAISADQLSGAERAAKSLHLTLHAIKLENPPYDIAAAFHRIAEGDPEMLLVLSSPLFGPHNKEIAEATLRHRLPAMFIFKYYVEDGGLMSYGIDIKSDFRRLAEYVAKISTARRRPIYRCRHRQSSSSSSISRPPRRSASSYRRRCSCAPTR